MEKRKNLLLHLYDDPDAEGDLRSLLRDKDLRREHQALSESKFRLDHLEPSRPEDATIRRILLQAGQAAPAAAPGRRRGDRPAMWRVTPLRRVLIPAFSIAAALVLAVALGLFRTSDNEAARAPSDRVADGSQAAAESLLRATPINPGLTLPASSGSADPMLAWDDADENLRELYRRIENLRPTDDLDWGARSIPLETLPGSALRGPQGVRPASERK